VRDDYSGGGERPIGGVSRGVQGLLRKGRHPTLLELQLHPRFVLVDGECRNVLQRSGTGGHESPVFVGERDLLLDGESKGGKDVS